MLLSELNQSSTCVYMECAPYTVQFLQFYCMLKNFYPKKRCWIDFYSVISSSFSFVAIQQRITFFCMCQTSVFWFNRVYRIAKFRMCLGKGSLSVHWLADKIDIFFSSFQQQQQQIPEKVKKLVAVKAKKQHISMFAEAFSNSIVYRIFFGLKPMN